VFSYSIFSLLLFPYGIQYNYRESIAQEKELRKKENRKHFEKNMSYFERYVILWISCRENYARLQQYQCGHSPWEHSEIQEKAIPLQGTVYKRRTTC